ncbi:MAG: FAD-dependent oxidoreductase [Deltaproteobacteria bacterium]|nr:FAD-dependent oxidoreductase [Deltaproteobacteria bacterium]
MSAKSKKNKVLAIILLAGFIGIFWRFDIGQYLSFNYLKSEQENLAKLISENFRVSVALFFAIYVISTALSLPGAAVLTLAAGALFGFWQGTLIVSFASTLGATLAFLLSRLILRDWVQRRFAERLTSINSGIEKEGAFYLFSLRLIPAFPFFLINLALGLTPMKAITFFWVSQVGMLPGTMAYVNAGTQLSKIDSMSGIVSLPILLSFAVLGILPLIAKRVMEFLRSRKTLSRFKRPLSYDYNLIVIGAGAAGLVTSYIAAAIKANVALIEKEKMGGDCLNTGCVPSKALIRSAKIVHYASRAKAFGLESIDIKFNFASVMERVQGIIKQIEPHDSVERYTKLGVDCINGSARIVSPFEVEVKGRKLTTRNIVIATGARPLVPSIPGLDKVDYFTSDTIWNLRELPKKLLVLGGGPIGSELSQCFNRLGANVTQIETNDCILSREDRDVSDVICKRFMAEGISVLTRHRAERVEVEDNRKSLICGHEGREVRVEFDQILIALGRKASVSGFGLEELGVKIAKNGTIEADEYLRTNYPNIYVAGDVTGPYQFTHFAAHQAWYASVNALFSPFKSFKADYRVIPWCTFTDPEVARVGLNEKEAKAKGIPYRVTTYDLSDLDRAIADSSDHGFIKVLTPPRGDRILGAAIVGEHAGDLLTEFVSGMRHGIGLNKILGTIHTYPTLSEANKYVAGEWKKSSVSPRTLELLKIFHAWRRKEGCSAK